MDKVTRSNLANLTAADGDVRYAAAPDPKYRKKYATLWRPAKSANQS